MVTMNIGIATAEDMSADITSAPIYVDQSFCLSVQAVMTGAPVGVLKLQVSNDFGASAQPVGVTNWTDSGVTASVSAAGTALLKIDVVSVRWVRLVYTKTSGTGSLTARMQAKNA